jgi:hypothetical protein
LKSQGSQQGGDKASSPPVKGLFALKPVPVWCKYRGVSVDPSDICNPPRHADCKSCGIKRQPLAGYNVGYIGFTHVPSLLADGICYFERWAQLSDIKVSHALIVTGPDECVEAHWPRVNRAPLSKYLNDPNTVTVFRKPRGWTEEMGKRIAATAASQIGDKYNVGLIAAQLMANTFIGHYLNKWFDGRPDAWMSARLDRKNQFICSELASWALNEQPELTGKGILAEGADRISPQELFEDKVVFEPRDLIER